MSLDPDTLSRLLHDLTPEPPVDVTVDDIAARMRHRRRTRTITTVATVCLLVVAAVTVPLALDWHTGSSRGGAAPADETSMPDVCLASTLNMSLTWKSTSGGGLAGALTVTNPAPQACILKDWPTLTPLNRANQPLDTAQFTPHGPGPGPLLVRAGSSAVSGVSWSDWCQGPLPTNRVRISWPSGGSRVVIASGTHLSSACGPHGIPPAGDLSSNWFAQLVPGPDRALTVTTNETYMSGQVTVQPPTRPASDIPASARDALTTVLPIGNVKGGTVTVEYGLFSDNVQGNYDPATKTTKLRYLRVPAYLVIVRTAHLAIPGKAGTGPGIVITGIEAATGKRLGVYGQGGDPTSAGSSPG